VPFLEKVSGDGQQGAPGVPLAQPLTVRVADSCGKPLAGQAVAWQARDGSVSPAMSTTGSNGHASASWTLAANPEGLNHLRAVSFPVVLTEVAFTAVLAGPANQACTNVVLEDPFAGETGWTKTTEAATGFSDSVTLEASGGNPGGYRRMTHLLAGRGSIYVYHLFGTSYTPRTQGVIRGIHYSEDRTQFDPPFPGAAVASGFLVEQEGRRALVALPEFRDTTWQGAEIDVRPGDLPGIDLSASGGPIHFGYYRANSDSRATTQHGIDNWRVAICR
jgi:hypothetical protein